MRNYLLNKPVLTKKDFVRRYKRGEFGNASPTWDTFSEYLTSGYKGLIHFRNRVAGGKTWYNVSLEEAKDLYLSIVVEGEERADNLYFSAMAPTKQTVIQGEVQRAEKGLEVYYSRVKRPMREALNKYAFNVSGSAAVCLLRANLCSNSYEWLTELLNNYPEHVIEFSTYSTNWGTIPGYNTVFWEVRRY